MTSITRLHQSNECKSTLTWVKAEYGYFLREILRASSNSFHFRGGVEKGINCR